MRSPPDEPTPDSESRAPRAGEALPADGGSQSSADADGSDGSDAPASRLLESAVEPDALPAPTESIRLLEAARTGDRDALAALVHRYEDRLRRIIRIRISARLRQSLESVDVMQETWRAAVQHIDGLMAHEGADILRWLARIAENHMLDVNRRLTADRRDRRREVPLPDPGDSTHPRAALPETSPAGRNPSELASERELRAIVDEAVAGLPEDYREVIVLRTYHGGSWEFVARAMGRPTAEAARVLHRRARIQLARILRDRLGETPTLGET